MPVFTFSGKNASGEKVQGERVAANKDGLASQLRKERITPGAIREKGKEFAMPTFGSSKVKVKDMAVFFRQFSVMIDAGLPLVQCLEILGANQENPSFQKTLPASVPPSKAARPWPMPCASIRYLRRPDDQHDRGRRDRRYSRHHSAAPGDLRRKGGPDESGGQVGADLSRGRRLPRRADRGCAAQVGGADLRQPLCRSGSRAAAAHPHCHRPQRLRGPFLVVLLLGHRRRRLSGSSRFASTRGAGYYFDAMLLKLPIIGILLRKIAVARFTRTLGTLITSGVPILEGLAITARTSGNKVLEEALMKVRKAIEEGRTIVDPLRECGVFPNMVTQMIGVGEATGAMDSMLQKIADFYEDEVDAATKDMLAMLEPVIIGCLGVSIGGIIISLYMPLFAMIGKLAG